MPSGDSLIFVSGPPFQLYEVSAVGGAPKPINEDLNLSGRRAGGAVQVVLSGSGERLLLAETRSPEASQMMIVNLGSGETTAIGPGAGPFYASSGYLFYQPNRTSEIWAQPFSLDRLEATGDAFPVALGGRNPTVSSDGTLAYVDDALTGGARRVVWRDRSGEMIGEVGEPQVGIRGPRISPDGKQVAVTAFDAGGTDVWLHQDGSATNRRVTTHEGDDGWPVWSPDGERIVFASSRNGTPGLFIRAASGIGQAELLFQSEEFVTPIDWAGKRILVRVRGRRASGFAVIEPDDQGVYRMTTLGDSAGPTGDGRFSPDGDYIVYELRGREEAGVYVQTASGEGTPVPISPEGGESPRWGGDRNELFFVRGDTLYSVRLDFRGGVRPSQPQPVFDSPALAGGFRSPGYDVSPDGTRFAVVEMVGTPPVPTIRVVLDWLAEFRR